MKIHTEKFSPLHWQILVWCIIFLTSFLSLLYMDGPFQALVYSVIGIACYALIIYGNIALLYPRLYAHGHIALYVLASLILIAGAGAGRAFISQFAYNRWFAKKYYPLTAKEILYASFACIVVFVLSFVFRLALAWFALRRETRLIQEQKSLAELNLLKSQVQPHFLFNTLNNIYYEAYREAPRTALLIGRLSEIMRYFVDESPKDRLPLAGEIAFLENYIALEKIRIRHGVDISLTTSCSPDIDIPPMLLMTFVENIFKHGIDRGAPGNKASISLTHDDQWLYFQTENPWFPPQKPGSSEGFGLRNLQKRLTLLYGSRFELQTGLQDNTFQARLKIPLDKTTSHDR